MVAPATGELKLIIDEMAVQLDTVDNLRVYKYPADSVQQLPAAIIRDNQATNQTAIAEYRSTSPVSVYNLEVLVLVGLADEQEAYEDLEKYISGDSASSVKTLDEQRHSRGYTGGRMREERAQAPLQLRRRQPLGLLLLGQKPGHLEPWEIRSTNGRPFDVLRVSGAAAIFARGELVEPRLAERLGRC